MPIVGSNLTQLIHPNLLDSLPTAFPALVNIQTAVESQNADNQVVKTWSDSKDLKGLNGILAAVNANEQRKANLTVVSATHVLDLKSYQPDIRVEDRAVVLTAVPTGARYMTFDIKAVEHDSQQTMTRLECEIASI